MKKLVRDYQKLCESEGVSLLGVFRRSRHYALHFERGYVIAPCTPSNRRSLLEVRSYIRHLHR